MSEPRAAAQLGRHHAEAGLDADQSATGGGNADGAHAVVAVRDGHHAGRDRRRRTAGGTARRAAEVPRVAADAERGVGGAEHAKLWHGGETDDHSARLAQPSHYWVVGALWGVGAAE